MNIKEQNQEISLVIKEEPKKLEITSSQSSGSFQAKNNSNLALKNDELETKNKLIILDGQTIKIEDELIINEGQSDETVTFSDELTSTSLSSPFQCPKCHRTFKMKQNFDAHVCVSNLTCSHCHVTFTSYSNLKNHMLSSHGINLITKGVACHFCGEFFTNSSRVKFHIRFSCRGGKNCEFSCDHCERKFMAKAKLRQHVMTHAIHPVECKICHIEVRMKSLYDHISKHYLETGEKFECEICFKSFKSLKLLKEHLKSHDKKFQCEICKLKFLSNSHLKTHKIYHENPKKLRCEFCGIQTKSKNILQKHLKIHFGTQKKVDCKSLEKKLKCHRCEFKTAYRKSLTDHLKSHEKRDEKSKNLPGAVKCNKCRSVLKSFNTYKMHYRRNHRKRVKFQCDLCEISKVYKSEIKKHLLIKHFTDMKFQFL